MNKLIAIIALGILFSCNNDKQNTPSKSRSITGDVEIDDVTRDIFKDQQNPELYYQRSQLYYKKELYDNAIYDLKKAISFDSLNPQYYHSLSDSYMDFIKSKEALSTMELAAKMFPERIPTLLKLSETQLILKQYESSVLTATKVLSLNPNEAEGYFMLGMNFKAAGDLEKAKNSFQTAIEMNPELIDGWLILGEMYEEQNNPLALDYYEGATIAQPNNLKAWHAKAYYLQNNNRISEAISIYKKMIAMDKYYAPSFLNMGILYLEKDSVDFAKDQFTILSKVSPQDFRAHFYLGMCNELLGAFDLARENFRSAQNLNPDDPRINKAIVRISEKQSSTEE